MNHKLLKASIAGAAVIALAAGGSTYAAWSDFQTVTGNETDAGHLVLSLDSTGTISNVGGQSIAPGQSHTFDAYLASSDLDGVPSGDLSLQIKHLVDNENGCASNSEKVADPTCAAANDPGEFSSQGYMRIRYSDPAPVSQITWNPATSTCSAPGGSAAHSYGYSPPSDNTETDFPTLAAVNAAGSIPLGTLPPNSGVCISITMGLPTTATNAVQGDSSQFDLEYDLVQTP